jgi:hypothetical protein
LALTAVLDTQIEGAPMFCELISSYSFVKKVYKSYADKYFKFIGEIKHVRPVL